MDTKQLQSKYSELTEALQASKLEKAKTENSIENAKEEQAKTEKQILELAGVDTIEAARKVLEELEAELAKLLKEAEKLLGE